MDEVVRLLNDKAHLRAAIIEHAHKMRAALTADNYLLVQRREMIRILNELETTCENAVGSYWPSETVSEVQK